jgi:RimJ/RimL family protein N-acetyltransferase
MRRYKCFNENVFSEGVYSLLPIRDEDKYDILNWRNSQIDILRQQSPLTKDQQDNYFKTVISQLFEQEQPSQLLWSFLLEGKLIGYGGLVHIDWEAKHGEISFLLCNDRNNDIDKFKKDWQIFLKLIIKVAFNELKFHKIHTYAYDIRDYYFEVMYDEGFEKEGQLKDHILINGKLTDILILSKFNI